MTETATQTLADFLLARLDEDEAPIRSDIGHINFGGGVASWVTKERADIAAKRAIIAEHPPMFNPLDSGTYCRMCVSPEGFGLTKRSGMLGQRFPCRTLRLLALPYADHADYRDEWRP